MSAPTIPTGQQAAGARQPAVLAWLHLMRVYDKVQRASARHLRRYGLTVPQFDVIAHLGAVAGLRQQDLADRLLVTKGNVCGLIDRLEADGLVERRPDPRDRRAHRLALTS